jgi:hypothetical protein
MDNIRTKPSNETYRNGWDRIFGSPIHCDHKNLKCRGTIINCEDCGEIFNTDDVLNKLQSLKIMRNNTDAY